MITKMDTVVQELENKESEKKAKSLQQAQTCATETQSIFIYYIDLVIVTKYFYGNI